MIAAVDYFAGAGGFSTGAAAAGLSVVAAVNHWPRAVETHAANHPATIHFCQDAMHLDPDVLPRFEWLLAAPSCTGHSPSRGKEQPRHDAARATAWCVVTACELRRPRVVLVENVPAFLKWALFPMWRDAMQALGYALSFNILEAADFGVAQERRRLIVVGVRGSRRAPSIVSPQLRHVTARKVINLDAGRWSPTAKKKPATQERIADGRRRFGNAPFLIAYYSSGSGKVARSLDRPIGTLTTVDRYGIVRGNEMRMVSVDEARTFMGFPDGYKLTGDRRARIKQLGNAICPPMAQAAIAQVMR